MSETPDYTAMDAPTMLSAVRDDGAKSAAAFCQTAKKLGYGDIDEGWMIGWFANAIEQSHAVRRWKLEAKQTALTAAAEAAREMRDATRKYEAVSARLMTTDTSEWQEASREQLQAERDLDAALEALAGVEG